MSDRSYSLQQNERNKEMNYLSQENNYCKREREVTQIQKIQSVENVN